MPRILAALLAALALLALSAPAAAGSATLAASPNPVTFTDSNAVETFSGCGYDPAVGVTIVASGPEAVSFFGGPVGADGCFSLSFSGFITAPGEYRAEAYQQLHPGRQTLQAATAFTVLP